MPANIVKKRKLSYDADSLKTKKTPKLMRDKAKIEANMKAKNLKKKSTVAKNTTATVASFTSEKSKAKKEPLKKTTKPVPQPAEESEEDSEDDDEEQTVAKQLEAEAEAGVSASAGSESDSEPEESSVQEGKEDEAQEDEAQEEEKEVQTFKELGVVDALCEACDNLGYKKPTPIQQKSIPAAVTGRDIIGLAETGSGKTAAFSIPILQALLDKPQPYFALVLAPTRELATQIGQVFDALGAQISLRCAVIIGGLDMITQSIALSKKPHVIVATPGRILDHLEKTKGFSLRSLKYLVMDEADRLLDMDFGPILDKILKFLPRERNTYLFSATMSSKIESLQRASLRNPVHVSISANKYQTVSTLKQNYVFIPHMHKDTYLIYLITEFAGQTTIVFTRTQYEAQRISILLRTLGFGAIPLYGQLSQTARLGALNKFKSGSREILVATDVAARGLDIPKVDLVINFDLPQDSKTYVHRVGRTARAGKSGVAITIMTQYDIEIFTRIEAALGMKFPEYPTEKNEVMVFQGRVEEAQHHAKMEMKQLQESKGNKRGGKTQRGPRGAGGNRRRHDGMDAEEG
ncbi:ATP-dependent rRNA helicase RRP3 [Ceratocystis fimbriata CBS 114723]|uniref:ATP-dependent rRNA helicase RRP3 n=1 Tax=Ceratocystis fimbriata CBS 114723 TaxID=1035309 RepID=A0A2C5X230_9PEZI|nr:ATP-dependent rRNA helicase RRP3 [Ceratocystis fimbriata CBS 114723]